MKRFILHTFLRHFIEWQMRNWQSIKYISHSSKERKKGETNEITQEQESVLKNWMRL